MGGLLIVSRFASGVSERRLAAVHAALPARTRQSSRTPPVRDHARPRSRRPCRRDLRLLGDGTYNEVLNAVSGDTPLGFVPGSQDERAPRALGLPRDPATAATRLAEARPGGSGWAA